MEMLKRGIVVDHVVGTRNLLFLGELCAQPRLGLNTRQGTYLDHSPHLFCDGGADAENYIIIAVPIALKK